MRRTATLIATSLVLSLLGCSCDRSSWPAPFGTRRSVTLPRSAPPPATPASIARTRPTGALPSCEQLPEVPSFRGAEGFGAVSRGGRCGRVIYVTTLAGEGPGSLREALSARGPRYVVFAVSGVIDAVAAIEQGRVTIAGQTSPGGVTVRGVRLDEESHDVGGTNEDVVVRHVRSRPNGFEGGLDDAIRITHARRVIVDHCSFGRAQDECVQISQARQVTVQASILAETIGDHAQFGGMLINYTDPPAHPLDELSIHHDVWTRIAGRMPEVSRESPSAPGSLLSLELSCNLLWGPLIGVWVKGRSEIPVDGPLRYRLNWINNLMQAGRYRGFMMNDEILGSERSSLFVAGNRHTAFPDWQDLDLVYCCNDLDRGGPNGRAPAGQLRRERHPFPSITYTPTAELPAWMAANAGAFPRDALDRRLMADIRAGRIDERSYGTAHVADAEQLAFMPGPAPAPPTDTDRDGMPDEWERAHGLDPAQQDHNGTSVCRQTLGYDGYTNLEVYLDELADRRVREGQ